MPVRSDGSQSAQAGSANETEKNCFRLIRPRVAQGDLVQPELLFLFLEQPAANVSCFLLQIPLSGRTGRRREREVQLPGQLAHELFVTLGFLPP